MNNGGEPVVAEGYQDDEGALMASGVYIGLCEGKIRPPMSIGNGGFSQNDEDGKEQQGIYVDTLEQTC